MSRHLWIVVGIGGGLGALAREGMSLIGTRGWFPLDFFAINILGSFLIGVVMALSVEYDILPTEMRLFFGVGVLGGFTTFSTYMLGAHNLLQHSVQEALTYLLGTWGIGLVAVWSGLLAIRSAAAWVQSRGEEGSEEEKS